MELFSNISVLTDQQLKEPAMLKGLIISAGVVAALFAAIPAAQSHANRLTDYRNRYPHSDFYLFIPPRNGVSCDEARAILQHKGYEILRIIQCGGNYHKFSVQRRGVDYRIHVMTGRGKRMIDARSS
jgi:hypothetical protein